MQPHTQDRAKNLHLWAEVVQGSVLKRLSQLYRRDYQIGFCKFECFCEEDNHYQELDQFIPLRRPDVESWEQRSYQLYSIIVPDLVSSIDKALADVPPDEILETYVNQCFHARYTWSHPQQFFLIETGASANRSYCILRHGRQVILLLEGKGRSFFTYLLRVIREIYLRESENLGGAMLHSAAVVEGKAATLIVGDKTAGKTSLALALSLSPVIAYLSNDRTLLMPNRSGAVVYPFPLACRIGVGTVEQLPPVRRVIEERKPLYSVQKEALMADDLDSINERRRFGSRVKLVLTPLELTHYLHIQYHGGASLARIVLPQLEPSCTRATLSKLSQQELADELKKHVIMPWNNEWVSPWIVDHVDSEDKITARMLSLIDDIAAITPGFRLKFNFNYWDNKLNSQIAKLLQISCC